MKTTGCDAPPNGGQMGISAEQEECTWVQPNKQKVLLVFPEVESCLPHA